MGSGWGKEHLTLDPWRPLSALSLLQYLVLVFIFLIIAIRDYFSRAIHLQRDIMTVLVPTRSVDQIVISVESRAVESRPVLFWS